MRCRFVRVASEQRDVPEGVGQRRAARRDPGGGGTRLFDPEVEVEDPNTKVLEALTPPKVLVVEHIDGPFDVVVATYGIDLAAEIWCRHIL